MDSARKKNINQTNKIWIRHHFQWSLRVWRQIFFIRTRIIFILFAFSSSTLLRSCWAKATSITIASISRLIHIFSLSQKQTVFVNWCASGEIFKYFIGLVSAEIHHAFIFPRDQTTIYGDSVGFRKQCMMRQKNSKNRTENDFGKKAASTIIHVM